MTEASCAKCHKQRGLRPEGREAERRLRDLRARRLLRLPQDARASRTSGSPGPILTQDRLEADAGLGEDLDPQSARGEADHLDAARLVQLEHQLARGRVRNEVEINATVAYLFANAEKHELAVTNPPRGDAKSGEQIVKSIGCLGCHVVDEKTRDEAGPAPHLRPAARRTSATRPPTSGSTTGSAIRSTTAPATYMPDLRLTDAQVADVATYLSTLKRPAATPPRRTPDQAAVDEVLLDYFTAVMPFEEAKADGREAGRAGEAARARPARHQPLRLLQLPRDQGLRERRSRSAPSCPKRAASWSRGSTSRSSTTSRTPRSSAGSGPSCTIRGSSTRAACCRRSRSCGCRTTTSPTRRIERLLTAIMSFQREIQPAAGDAGARSARRDFLDAGPRRSSTAATASAATSSKARGGDYLKLVADPSLGPPLLTPEGARVQPDWLYAFLRAPITIRPWLDVRMPTFGLDDQNLNGVIQLLRRDLEQRSGRSRRTRSCTRRRAPAAPARSCSTCCKCQQCHVLGAIPKDQPTANLAPDLRMASRAAAAGLDSRLAARRPATILPGTRMPAFWPDYPKSFYPQLGGDAEAQIRAIRDHLLTLRGGPSPEAADGAAAGSQLGRLRAAGLADGWACLAHRPCQPYRARYNLPECFGRTAGACPRVHPTAYIDDSAQVIGDVEIGEESSVWMTRRHPRRRALASGSAAGRTSRTAPSCT